MKNLLGMIVLGIFLYIVMGGSLPSFTHYLDDNVISYDEHGVQSDDVFVGLHVVQDENGRHRIQGVSHWGQLLRHDFWSGIFHRDPAVQRSYVNQSTDTIVHDDLPCQASFVDVGTDELSQDVILLGDLCIVGGVGDRFYPQNHIRRGSAAKMVAGALTYAYEGTLPLPLATGRIYDDVPLSLHPYITQLESWGLLDSIARTDEVFGVDDVLTRDQLVVFLEDVMTSLPETIETSDVIPLALESDYVERQMFAHMLVHALQIDDRVATGVLAVR